MEIAAQQRSDSGQNHRKSSPKMETCCLCETVFQQNNRWKTIDKRQIDSTQTQTHTSVLSAMKEMYAYEGRREGHVCGQCFLKVEKDYQTFRRSTPADELDSNPGPTQQTEMKAQPGKESGQNPQKSLSMKDICCLCEGKIQKKETWKRRTHSKLRNNDQEITFLSAMKEMYNYEGRTEGHLCWKCGLKVERDYRAWQRIVPPGQQIQIETKDSSPSTEEVKKKKIHRFQSARLISRALENSKYYTALRHILARGPAAESAFRKLMKKLDQKEARNKKKGSSQLAESTPVEKDVARKEALAKKKESSPKIVYQRPTRGKRKNYLQMVESSSEEGFHLENEK